MTDPTTGISHTIPGTDLVNQDFEPVKPTEKVPVKDKAHLTPEEKKQVADKVKAKNPGKEVTVGDDGTATVTDPTTGISHIIPATDLVIEFAKGDSTSAEASATQPQAVLPNTGTQEDRATGALGVLSLLGTFGLLAAKKKKDDEEEA